jgi:hypothetical protein
VCFPQSATTQTQQEAWLYHNLQKASLVELTGLARGSRSMLISSILLSQKEFETPTALWGVVHTQKKAVRRLKAKSSRETSPGRDSFAIRSEVGWRWANSSFVTSNLKSVLLLLANRFGQTNKDARQPLARALAN